MRTFRALAATAIVVLVAAACDPVVPVVTPDSWQFEGYQVYSHVPDDAVGIVYVFHGSGGSAEIVNKIEPTDQLNALVESGYGYVATESTERTGTARWQVFDPSLVSNPDLARLTRLHSELVATTAVDPTTPIFGLGMSNGARMVTLFAQSFADAGYPVAAVAPFMGREAPSVTAAGGLTVPAVWVIAENDSIIDNEQVIAAQAANAANGVASILLVKHEESLTAVRFQRIPAVDEAESEQIRTALIGSGAWDSNGQRIVSIPEMWSAVGELNVPPQIGASAQQLGNQIGAMVAEHQFVGLFRQQVVDFFDAQLAPPPDAGDE